uniref:Uncharacterized protein n=1 Tax=Paramoeba aestuarina TaxID=180227 RepID=A0A7S4U7V9_9EUKA|mmetsp:Transcript_6200/g.9372  ORF Transcript_6200/g.9372 Transcript_6200/m.9372 type:complete len:344 (+) Transcript_6200:57-1088(+)
MFQFWKAQPETDTKEQKLDAEEPVELSPEEKHRNALMMKKTRLNDELNHTPKLGHHFSYDKIFRPVSKVLMENMGGDNAEGLVVATTRQYMNMSISSKYSIHDKQDSAWELMLQMHGFSDFVSATYNSLNRYQLMYQRVFKTGAMLVGQFMVQPGMMTGTSVPAGNFFSVFEYPWGNNGCTSVSYLKGQYVTLSHTQKILRGLYIGSSATYDFPTHDTRSSYALQSTSSNKKSVCSAEVKDNGDARIALVRKDWGSSSEIALEVDYSEGKHGFKTSSFNAGIHRDLFGKGSMSVSLLNFQKIKAVLELPFGLDRPGWNQVNAHYNMSYDIHNSGFKHGIQLHL